MEDSGKSGASEPDPEQQKARINPTRSRHNLWAGIGSVDQLEAYSVIDRENLFLS